MAHTSRKPAVVVGTWAFSAQPVTVAAQLADQGEACVECVEKALNVVEDDASYGVYQVGCGGPPNQRGEVEQDAAIMSGRHLSFGAVTALQGISRASSVARCVMEQSAHSMLTAQGAKDFALHCGFQLARPHTQQDTGGSGRSGETGDGQKVDEALPNEGGFESAHDTMGVLVLDSQGNLAAGVTTSGMKGKARGRIGDSALPGCGLYADNEVGAVCCSGAGDEILKFCPSFLVMENMRQGMSPGEACETAVKRIQRRVAPVPVFELVVIAVNNEGEVGAAGTVREWRDIRSGNIYPGFPYVLWKSQNQGHSEPRTLVAPPIS